MKQEGFQVVAEVYRLLGGFEPSAIAAAAEVPGISENLRSALVALHRETTSHGARGGATEKVPAKNAARPSSSARSLEPIELLLDTKRFPTKQDLVEFCRTLGLNVEIDAKASRERIARRLARIVNDDQQAREKMYELVKWSPSDQTSGWIGVIRRGQ